METAVVALPGYTFTETLYDGSRTQVYRALRESDQQPTAVKTLRNPHPGLEELLRFRNQYTIGRQLAHAGLVPMEALLPYGHTQALVMQDVAGLSLAQYVESIKGHRLPLAKVLLIAVQLSEILHYLGQQRVIHKDIKPANILIHPESGQVWLIDFSIASLLPKETQEIKNPNGLEGTLNYLAPEQTGRMNRGIDYRADFYALGVTLFELLTGELPCQSDDPMMLIHCHIAKQPPWIQELEPDVPLAVAAIVHKLMAKNAEDRYQSALGLKHDLETCLHQLEETGQIEPFEIGQQDSCDRFTIPEKLYGREADVQALLAAFDRVAKGKTEMMLVAGFSGIGKTAIVNEVHKPITRQQGYFIKGKFDQFNRNVPLSAFVKALQDLMGQLLSESDRQLAQWRTRILEAVGENGQVLIEVIPQLAQVIGPQPPVSALTWTAAQNRFNALFKGFISVFTTAEHPLVMFLDDLQWADTASLQLMKLLMQDQGHLLLLGAYRDNEVFPAHPFMQSVSELLENGASIHTVTLQPLLQSQLNRMVAETLNCQPEVSLPLSDLIYQKTQGNPFFTTQFLQGLYKEGQITFDHQARVWQCDIVKVRSRSLTTDVVEFMAAQLQQLPAETQHMLKLAACIGAQFDLHTLAIVSEQSQPKTAAALWRAIQEGFVLPVTETYKFFQTSEADTPQDEIAVPYQFLHDRVQQAAYSLIPEQQQQATHLKIGQMLLARTSASEREERLFDIVNHLNVGKSLIVPTAEREELIQLNLAAGQKAKISTAYSAATDYLMTGVELLADDCWQSCYALTLALHEAAAEVMYLSGKFEQMEAIAQTTLSAAQALLDKITIYEILIQASLAQNKPEDAVEIALEVLKQLGIQLPQSPNQAQTLAALAKTKLALAGKRTEDLVNLPVMLDPKQLATMRILSSALSAAFIGAPKLFPLLVFQQITLSVKYGNTPLSAFAYAWYATILCGVLIDIEGGDKFGQLALQVLERFQVESWCKTVFVVNCFVAHWKHPLKLTLPKLQDTYQNGVETGDLEYAGWSTIVWGFHSYWAGQKLADIERALQNYSEAVSQFKHSVGSTYLNLYRQSVLNLMGQAADPRLLAGPHYSEAEDVPSQMAAGDRVGLFLSYVQQLHLRYLFGDFAGALEAVAGVKQYEDAGIAFTLNVSACKFSSLVQLALYDNTPKHKRPQLLRQVAKNQRKLKKWARLAPENVMHRFHLVEAERHRALQKRQAAADYYDLSIVGARENGFLLDEALANELAAKCYLSWGKDKIATAYLQEAYDCYSSWGAIAKLKDLEDAYPQLLKHWLQQQTLFDLTPSEIDSDSLHQSLSLSSATYRSRTASTGLNAAIDFTAILQASQSLSSTIHLDELLGQLTQIVLQNAGGDRCTLLLPNQDNSWQVAAIATPESTVLRSEPLEGNPCLPVKLIQYVKNTSALVMIDDLDTNLPVIDDYLRRQQPKSLVCLPLLNQGHLIGILHLENRLTSCAFTKDRIEILNLLCTQATISLENARLYKQSQAYSQQLESSQLQLVQSEKMSALGNLVAGVAHEINNPVGFLKGNIQPAQAYVNDLFDLIDLLLEKMPALDEDLEEHIEEIDLDFVRKDLPELLNSMDIGVERIRSISTSLRTFSRADQDHKTAFDLHEGLDSTLLILKHRLKANESRPAIEIVKHYGDLPPVDCFPGQLNQVFMNILANSIDALDESNQGKSFAEIKENPNQIEVTTCFESDRSQVSITLKDNGVGMPETVKAHIFDHLYTTKKVGKGTGLGLAIAQQIVREKHDGQIVVRSTPGEGTEFVVTLPATAAP